MTGREVVSRAWSAAVYAGVVALVAVVTAVAMVAAAVVRGVRRVLADPAELVEAARLRDELGAAGSPAFWAQMSRADREGNRDGQAG